MATRVEEVVRSAARRRFAVVLVEQLAFALLPVLAGFIILLLLGTQILHWYWMAAMIAAGLAIAMARIRARQQTHYQTAQVLDHRLRLDDSISTAWFLLEQGVNGHNPVASFQIQQAETLARRVQPGAAFPLVWRRAWMLTGSLAAVAFGLFAVRYLVTGSLSLQQSIAPVQITPVFEVLASRLHGDDPRRADQTADGKADQDTPENGTQLPDQKRVDDPQPQENAGQSVGQANTPGDKSQAESGKPDDEKTGDGQNSNSSDTQQAQKSDQSAANEKNPQGTDKRQANSAQQGLMDKMKDALSSLMAKMQNAGQRDQQNNQASNDDKAGSQNSGKAQQGQQQQQAQNRQSNQDQSAESQNQAQASERTQASQGHSSDAMPEKGADAHSGIGRQDGDKAVKEAEQLAAMGKLAEIIGKRSANLTGDMTVETPPGKEQLKTAYSGKMGHHADTGGEINRDEIPLVDQQYVREYMELVRKQSKPQD